MKYVVMLGDGMADLPNRELGMKTPLELAKKPNMDFLAQNGTVGMVKTVPEGMPPGSDAANLSVIGYNPRCCYTGRSPLEAVSMGIDLHENDIALRCNLVTLAGEGEYKDAQMLDYSADEITTEEATELINFLNKHFKTQAIELYPGVSYRHCLVIRNSKGGSVCTPPHDILDKGISDYLPRGENGKILTDMMKRSAALLSNHPVNIERVKRGLNPANSCWFWGEGTKPSLPSFEQKYGVSGGVISAVDLMKGIGICAGLKAVKLKRATGNIDTDYREKAAAAIDVLEKDGDFVYIHVEAADECGHRGEVQNKIKAIELIDGEVLGPVLKALAENGEPFSVLLAPDHPTPLELRTHTSDPVPFVLYNSNGSRGPSAPVYTERACAENGLFIAKGYELMDMLIKGDF